MSRRPRTIRSAAALAVLTVVTAACGSTAQRSTEIAAGGSVVDGAVDELTLGTTPGSATAPGPSGSSDPSGPSGPAGGSGPGASGTTAGNGPGAGSNGAGPSADGPTPGLTASEIFVGLSRTESTGSVQESQEAAGVSGVTTVDAEATTQMMIDHYNERGGIAGRQIMPVYHVYDAQSAESDSVRQQAACTTFTEDNEVFVAIAAGGGETYDGCMEDAGVMRITSGLIGMDAEYYRQYPSLFMPHAVNLNRMASSYVDGLVDAGFLTTGSKIGLSYTGCPYIDRAVTEALEPALARRGLALTDKFAVRCIQSQAEIGAAVSENSSSVLRFRQKGVDRVLFIAAPGYQGLQELLFMRNAESQGYHPRYGFTSMSAPHAAMAAGNPSNAPSAQLEGSVAIGWFPLADAVAATREPLPDSARRCLAIYDEAGFGPVESDNELGARLNFCESWFLLAEALEAAQAAGPVTRDSVVRAIENLGTSHVTTAAFGATFGPGRHDGASHWRLTRYHTDCKCYRYEGPRHPFPG